MPYVLKVLAVMGMFAIGTNLLVASTHTRVLNVNWICADSAPCISVILPRHEIAIVGSDVESFKMEVLVHRQQGEKERILQKWSASESSPALWNVEIMWYRLVEKGVRIPMQNCRNKLVCIVPLLDDEAITIRETDDYEGSFISHHFQVTVNFQGHKAMTSQEIIVQRRLSGGSGDEGGVQVQQKHIPQASSEETGGIESGIGDYMRRKQMEEDKLKEKRKNQLVGSELHTGANPDGAALVEPGYETKNSDDETTPASQRGEMGYSSINGSKNKTLIGAKKTNDISEGYYPVLVVDQKILNGSIDNSGSDEFNITINSTSKPWHHTTDDYLSKIFLYLGPTVSVLILLTVAIMMAVMCVCGVNKYKRKVNLRAMYRYHKMDQDPEQARKFQQTFMQQPPKDGSKRRGSRVLRKVLNSVSSLVKTSRKNKKKAPRVSAGRRRQTSDETSEETDDFEDEDDSLLSDDSDEESDDDDDDDEESMPMKMGRKIKEKSSKVFKKVKNNETFKKLQSSAKKHPVFTGAKAAAQNVAEGKLPIGDKPLGNKSIFSRLCDALSILMCPCSYICRTFCDCLCGWCQGNQLQRVQKKAQAQAFSFMPSRGPVTSSDSDNDEVNLIYKKADRKNADHGEGKEVTVEQPKTQTTKTSAFTPKTDISGRFYPNPKPHIPFLRDSYDNSSREEGPKIIYPSSRAIHESLPNSTSDEGIRKENDSLMQKKNPRKSLTIRSVVLDMPNNNTEPRIDQVNSHSPPSIGSTQINVEIDETKKSEMPSSLPNRDVPDPRSISSGMKSVAKNQKTNTVKISVLRSPNNDVPGPSTGPLTDHECSCHLNAGDSAITISPSCRNESLHSPRKHRCGLHCIQQQQSSLSNNRQQTSQSASVDIDHQPAHRPMLPPLLSRTPPLDVECTEMTSSSNSEHGQSLSSNGGENELSSTTTEESKHEMQNLVRGDAGTASASVLERAKEYFRRENEHMNALMESWEERTGGLTYANGRGRCRSRTWIAHRRNRRRELSLQQESRSATSDPAKNNTTTTSTSGTPVASETSKTSPCAQKIKCPPRLLYRRERLAIPNMEETLKQPDQSCERLTSNNNHSHSPVKQSQFVDNRKVNLLHNSVQKQSSQTKEMTKKTGKKANSVHSSEIDDVLGTDSSGDYSVPTDDVMRSSDDAQSLSNKKMFPKSARALRAESELNADDSLVTKEVDMQPQLSSLIPTKTISQTSFGKATSSADGDGEYLSVPNSPRKFEKIKGGSILRNDILEKFPPGKKISNVRRVYGKDENRENALRSAAYEFLEDEDYMSSSDDGEDDFWRVAL